MLGLIFGAKRQRGGFVPGPENMVKAVCWSSERPNMPEIRYIIFQGEAGRNDLVKVAREAVLGYLKPIPEDQSMSTFGKGDQTQPWFLPVRLLFVVYLNDGSTRTLLIRCGTREESYDLVDVAVQAVGRHLGSKVAVANLVYLGEMVEDSETPGRWVYQPSQGTENVIKVF